MATRIFDIARKLDLDVKEVLAKAEALKIPDARAAASELDESVADLLENQLRMDHPFIPTPATPRHFQRN